MATYIKTITDGTDQIAPRTKTSAVTDASGNNLDTITSGLASRITTLEGKEIKIGVYSFTATTGSGTYYLNSITLGLINETISVSGRNILCIVGGSASAHSSTHRAIIDIANENQVYIFGTPSSSYTVKLFYLYTES